MTIMHIVKIFSLSVSEATLPNPTLVMHDMVKYSAVTYMVFLGGPCTSSVALAWSVMMYEYGYWVMLASFHSHEYWYPFSASDRPTDSITKTKSLLRRARLPSTD